MLLSPALTRTTFQLTVDQVTPASFVDLEAEAADDGDESDDEESDEGTVVISSGDLCSLADQNSNRWIRDF